MKRIIVGIIIALAAVGVFFWDRSLAPDSSSTISGSTDRSQTQSEPGFETEERVVSAGRMYDVDTETKVVGSVTVLDESENGPRVLRAEFPGYPDPDTAHFYEGWFIQRSSGKVISTGRLVKSQDSVSAISVWRNDFTLDSSHDGFDQYILTLETVGGDERSELHIAEGKLSAL